MDGWIHSLTAAYDNIGRCRRQRLVFGILQLLTQMVDISLATSYGTVLWHTGSHNFTMYGRKKHFIKGDQNYLSVYYFHQQRQKPKYRRKYAVDRLYIEMVKVF